MSSSVTRACSEQASSARPLARPLNALSVCERSERAARAFLPSPHCPAADGQPASQLGRRNMHGNSVPSWQPASKEELKNYARGRRRTFLPLPHAKLGSANSGPKTPVAFLPPSFYPRLFPFLGTCLSPPRLRIISLRPLESAGGRQIEDRKDDDLGKEKSFQVAIAMKSEESFSLNEGFLPRPLARIADIIFRT